MILAMRHTWMAILLLSTGALGPQRRQHRAGRRIEHRAQERPPTWRPHAMTYPAAVYGGKPDIVLFPHQANEEPYGTRSLR
jgi:hypothetical protein